MKTQKNLTPTTVLRTWRTLMAALPKMNEVELERALEHELENGKRKDCIARIHRRLAKLKKQREIKEMLQ